MRVSAKADYALRAAIELAAEEGGGPVKGERVAQAQEIPVKFLENILGDLRQAGIVRSQRGAEGGYWLARPAAEITLAQVIRAVDGPLANVRGVRPESIEYAGSAGPLPRRVDRRTGEPPLGARGGDARRRRRRTLPDVVGELVADPEAWVPHP